MARLPMIVLDKRVAAAHITRDGTPYVVRLGDRMVASEGGEFGQFAEPALLILDSLTEGAKHGYALMADIEARTGRPLGPGTLYAALARLEARGHVRALAPVERRRPYELTDPGARFLEAQLQHLSTFSTTGLRRLAERAR